MKINIIRQVWRSIHLCLLFLFHPSSQTPPSFCSHPAAGFVLEGLCHRFHLGFSPSQKLKSAKKNKPSAAQHPSMVDQYLAIEVSLGRVAGPFSAPPFPNLHVSSFGVIPKRGASSWTFPPRAGPVSMMGLTRTNSTSITSCLIR